MSAPAGGSPHFTVVFIIFVINKNGLHNLFVKNAKAEFENVGVLVEKFTTDANVSTSDVDALITLDSLFCLP